MVTCYYKFIQAERKERDTKEKFHEGLGHFMEVYWEKEKVISKSTAKTRAYKWV